MGASDSGSLSRTATPPQEEAAGGGARGRFARDRREERAGGTGGDGGPGRWRFPPLSGARAATKTTTTTTTKAGHLENRRDAQDTRTDGRTRSCSFGVPPGAPPPPDPGLQSSRDLLALKGGFALPGRCPSVGELTPRQGWADGRRRRHRGPQASPPKAGVPRREPGNSARFWASPSRPRGQPLSSPPWWPLQRL